MRDRRSEPRQLAYKSIEFTVRGETYVGTIINISDSVPVFIPSFP